MGPTQFLSQDLMAEFDRLERAEGPGARQEHLALLDKLEHELQP